jgi:hypothetical protein
MIEKDVMEEKNLSEMIKIDQLFAAIDAFSSFVSPH